MSCLPTALEKMPLHRPSKRLCGQPGLTVLSQGEYADTVPTVSLEVRAIKPPDGRIYAADIVLDCLDNVSSRQTTGVFTAIIWSKNVLALLGAVDQGRIMDGEKKLIEMFLGDYAQANQK